MSTKRMTVALAATLGTLLLVLPASADERGQASGTAKYVRMGHSEHGEAFDEGPRQRPWKMEGIGKTHFPITTSLPEVQEWFDQGHTLLQSYWAYEAERAFRWCLKLDPECAMAYWGLYRCTADGKRAAAFLREASKRKGKVSERERMYIEAWEDRTSAFNPLWFGPKGIEGQDDYFRKLQRIMLKYPDDVEAKALYANDVLFPPHAPYGASPTRYGNELILQEILAKHPDHPGAHHLRIHNWDGPDAEKALDSFVAYVRIAPNAGHAPHMVGHGYGALGMWHEAAISMDASTRVEQQYMRQRMIFPFNNDWYCHNLNYLCYIREQLGMADGAVDGARQMLAAPLDPKYNNPDRLVETVYVDGLVALIRALVRYERWEEILRPDAIPVRDKVVEHQFWEAYAAAVAHLGLGNLTETDDRLAKLRKLAQEERQEKADDDAIAVNFLIHDFDFVIPEIEGLLALARGDNLEGLRRLTEAAERELKHREENNDPPTYPRVLYNVVGETYLKLKTPGLAVQAFEKALEVVRNDGIALSGLAQAHFALGEKEKAAEYYGRLLFVWSDADPGLRWMESAKALGLKAEPMDDSPAAQRNYRKTNLDHFGPAKWEPYDAPKLEALDSQRKTVTLDNYRGRNLVLIFYLGEECPHCVEQLTAIKNRISDFSLNNTEVAAISSAPPERIASSETLASLSIRLLSDTDHANAKRFHSYDEFEEMELHSTILIDGRGKVRWARSGGDPFLELDFLVGEIERVNGVETTVAQAP